MVASTPGGRTARAVGIVGLVALAAIAGALAFQALTQRPAPGPSVAPYVPGSLQPDDPLPTDPLVPSGRMIVAVDGESAWRVTAGVCGTLPPVIESTSTNGRSWEPIPVELGSIAAVAVGEVVTVTGQSPEGCELTTVAYRDGSWQPSTEFVQRWWIDPRDGALVSPGGATVAPPCSAVGIAGSVSGSVALICADQTIVRSTDSGQSWGDPLALPGVVAIAPDADRFVVAAGHQIDCTGVLLIALPTDPADATATALGCAPLPYRSVETALDVRGQTLWLWAGDTTATSADGGNAWR